MHALVAASLVAAIAGCATTHITAEAATCPTIAPSWTPRPFPKVTITDRAHPCAPASPTPGADGLRYGPDLDEALHCVGRYYTGPDGLPIDAMLKAALDALVRAHPVAQRAAVSAIIDDVDSIDALTRTLLRVAMLARMAIGFWGSPAPEDVLLRGAFSALRWKTEFWRPPFAPRGYKPAESFTAEAKDFLVYVKIGDLLQGVAARVGRELAMHPPTGVILDLRGSTGGLFSEALSLADLFTRSGCLFVLQPPREHAVAHSQSLDVDAPLVILIDHKTAAGSELVAATLRARDRALLIGDKTRGEGLVHSVIKLRSGAIVKLPIGEMLAGDGTPIQGRGVEPDVALPASFEPERSADDRAIDFAKQVLRGTHGGARNALAATARALAARATR